MPFRHAACCRLVLLQAVLLTIGPAFATGIPVHAPGTRAIVRILSSLPPEAENAGPTLEQAARGFLASYFGLWSQDNATAMAFVEGEYADVVDFYGKPTPRQTIVELKRKFVERWPERSYLVRPASLSIACDAGTGTCLISGIVDWDCRSASRGARSSGASEFTVRVSLAASAAKVMLEAGSTIARSP